MKNKALFIDRDGTIIEHVPYINDPAKVVLRSPVVERIRSYQQAGYLVIIITNQSGIARGLITREQYENVTNRMLELLKKEGVRIDDIFMCSSHPDSNDPRRKPNPGMILEAAQKHGIDLSESLMVGDDQKDVEAGSSAGVGTCLDVDDFISLNR